MMLSRSTKSGSQFYLSDRDRVDSIRGLACILLVYYHAVADVANYMKENLDFLEKVNFIIADIRMPLFGFISGLIYAYHPVIRSGGWGFVQKKFVRIIIPFICLTVILIGMKGVYGGSRVGIGMEEIPHYLIYGYSHLWFLPAMFIIFSIYSACGAAGLGGKALYASIMAGAAVLSASNVVELKAFAVDRAVDLLPFFSFGALVSAAADTISRYFTAFAAASVAASLASLAMSSHLVLDGMDKSWIVSLPVGFASLFAIYLLFPRNSVLAGIGRSSFTIYLFHSAFTALGIRIVNFDIVTGLAFCVVLSLLGPMAIEAVITRWMPYFGFVIGKGFSRGYRRAPAV